mmetsp:Transcript_37948/g.117275  ORF Transcript_37948/g.117275 Transcript_37948/m.117275 type:complete len:202 (+) Transcript_37948:1597-2202(+)
MQQKTVVKLLPPSAVLSRCVSFESRKATCGAAPRRPPFGAGSESWWITVVRHVRDLLMWPPSIMRCPVAPVFDTRSEPAKSTRFMEETTFFSSLRPGLRSTDGLPAPLASSSESDESASKNSDFSTMTRMRQCDREDCSFIFVDATTRFFASSSIDARHSAAVFTGRRIALCTKTPCSFSRMDSFAGAASRLTIKSRSCSL